MISIIAALAENNVIGKGNKIPWHIPEDFKRFKKITLEHPVIMGRNTFESILEIVGNPLPKRENIVITRQKNYRVPEGVKIYDSLDAALHAYKEKDVFIIGGAQIYAQAISKADTMYLTHIKGTPEGDAYFPEIDWSQWKLEKEETHDGFRFAEYTKI